jgi:hypothetical protein
MIPYREHQIERPEPWYAGALDGLRSFVDYTWPLIVALGGVVVVGGGTILAVSAGVTSREERATALATEARSWSTAVGFQVVGVYCYGDAVCDVSVGSAEIMRVLYLHCVPGEGCVPR